jgi:hypothetical protein
MSHLSIPLGAHVVRERTHMMRHRSVNNIKRGRVAMVNTPNAAGHGAATEAPAMGAGNKYSKPNRLGAEGRLARSQRRRTHGGRPAEGKENEEIASEK